MTKKTNNTFILNIPNIGKTHKIWKVTADELLFNVLNGRIADKILEKINKENIDNLKPEHQKMAEYAFDILSEQPEYKELKRSILQNGQSIPLVLNKNNIVIDGNTRLYLIRKLISEGLLKSNYQIQAIILDKKYNSQEIEVLETQLQFQFTDKIQYSAINRKIKMTSIHKANLSQNLSELDSFKKIKEQFPNYSIKQIQEEVNIYKYMLKVLFESDIKVNHDKLNTQNGHFYYLMKAEKYMESNKVLKPLISDYKYAAIKQINKGVSLIRSFREIAPINKTKAEWLHDSKLFNNWLDETEKSNLKEDFDEANNKIIQAIRKKRTHSIRSRAINPINKNVIEDPQLWSLHFAIDRLYNQLEFLKKNQDKIGESYKNKLNEIHSALKRKDRICN